MSEANAITNRLIKLGEELADDLSAATVVLSDSGVMDTDELKQLLEVDTSSDTGRDKIRDETA